MAPLLDDKPNGEEHYVPRILVIGAGQRGQAYAEAIQELGNAKIVAVAEPIAFQRQSFGSKYIWGDNKTAAQGEEFDNWQDFVAFEHARRAGQIHGSPPRIDAVFVCVLDEQHVEVITALAPFKFHLMCEKPLATTLRDCLSIYTALQPESGRPPSFIFGIGHVLRYSPHNMLLRDLVLEQNVIGDVLSIEHTEPVGWWHYSHSYVRGNWRRESKTAPSLLTKSCHDIDWLLWMMCSSPRTTQREPHLPAFLSSTGSLVNFKKSRKPTAAGNATNCLSCPIESTCLYSAKKIYHEKLLAKGWTQWPVTIVNPEIEECYETKGAAAAEKMLMSSLAEDYDASMSEVEKSNRTWYGRCVWESDNDVNDDQFVTITWEDQPDGLNPSKVLNAKTATFHMIAGTEKQCERRGRIYGSIGEIEYDGTTIRVYDFATASAEEHHPPRAKGGHGGGDGGLVRQFLEAVTAAETGIMSVEEAQTKYLGCSLEEVVRSHALVFAAEDARRGRKVVDWQPWWDAHVANAQTTE